LVIKTCMVKNFLFSDLDKDIQIRRCTIPQHVSITKNPDNENYEQVAGRQEKFTELPYEIKEKLSSHETGETIKGIGKNFNLKLLQLADISRAIRSYYFGEIKLEGFPNILAREIPVDISIAQQIAKQVIEKIINDKSLGVSKNLVESSLKQAIQAYPNLGEQLITSGMIRLKIFPQPVRPSIKNWIEDYRSVMGAERHGMMERGNYLFHTENTKRLASGERKKLAEVLRSLDEDVTLSVDPDRQEIIFNQVEEMKPVEKMSNSQFLPPQRDPAKAVANEIPSSQTQNKIPNTGYKIPDASMRFSSPHVLPSEKNDKPSGYQAVSPSESSDLPKRQVFNSPSFDSKAGKPWEPASTSQRRGEPRVSGNTVDLRN